MSNWYSFPNMTNSMSFISWTSSSTGTLMYILISVAIFVIGMIVLMRKYPLMIGMAGIGMADGIISFFMFLMGLEGLMVSIIFGFIGVLSLLIWIYTSGGING